MKRLLALIGIAVMATAFTVAGCKKQEPQTTAEQPAASAPASPGQEAAPATPAAPTHAEPAKK